MGKSSNLELVRTVIDLKSEHSGASADVEYERPFSKFERRFGPVSVRPRTTLVSLREQ